jgi:hypothetical protein
MDRVNIYDDIVYRLRTEHERFARVPQENKFMLGPLVHARLSSLFIEAAKEIEQLRKQRDSSSAVRLKGWICFEEGKTDGK